jgi:lysylphosphatidylglycerol synthetase-like protein (DUF2156 family)
MNPILRKTLLWLPRGLGILFVLFTSLFSLDVFDMGMGLWETIMALFMHLLVPSLALAAVVALAWRWEWVGAAGFGLWAVIYPLMFRGFDLSAYLILSGIPLLIAALYLVGWFLRNKIRA